MRPFPTPHIPDSELTVAVEAVERAVAEGALWPLPVGSFERSAISDAAAALGVNVNTLKFRIQSAFKRLGRWPMGVDPGWIYRDDSAAARRARREARQGKLGLDPVLPGYEIASTTTSYDKAGKVSRRTVRQKPEAEQVFELPEKRRIGKSTTQVGPDGRVEREWVRHSPEDNAAAVIEAAKAAFESYRGWARLPPAPIVSDHDTITVYPLADLHLGMFAWAAETGEDFDLKIAVDLIRRAFGALIRRSPPSRRAVVLGLGDLLHADNSENRTMRSGHVLDVDTRYQKVLTASALLLRQLIEMASAHHEAVTVRVLPGNHDEHSASALTIAMAMAFDGSERVEIDQSPDPYWWMRFGVNLFGAHHGHLSKPSQGAGIMASSCAHDWGQTVWRHMFYGHLHHKQKGGEDGGMTWEIMQSPAARDAYNAGKGYWAGRSLSSRTFHRTDGPVGSVQENIRPSLRILKDAAA
jgi:hypothetical protein